MRASSNFRVLADVYCHRSPKLQSPSFKAVTSNILSVENCDLQFPRFHGRSSLTDFLKETVFCDFLDPFSQNPSRFYEDF